MADQTNVLYQTTGDEIMPVSMWKQHTFSLAMDPLSELTTARHTTLMGGIAIDLISAPIEPGIYDIRFAAVMGGITIFIPAYVMLQSDGRSFWGGKQLYGAEQFWTKMQRTFASSSVHVPPTPPLWALQPHDERAVTLRISVNSLMGGIRIYQLEPEAAKS